VAQAALASRWPSSAVDAYVSPSWYATKAEHGRVSDWNYITAHVYGQLVVHDDRRGWRISSGA